MTKPTLPASTPRRLLLLRLARPMAAMAMVLTVPLTASAMAAVESSTQAELNRFLTVFEEVKANYVEPVSDDKLIDGAISGMLAALDPHSSFLDASDFATLRTQTDGQYGGIGLTLTQEDGAVKIIAPMAGTPAARAGLKPGDYITHIDGELLLGYSLDEAANKMRGPAGSTMRLTVVRPGRDAPIQVQLTREVIVIRPVTWEVHDNIGVLKLSGFSGGAAREMRTAMAAVERQLGHKPTGWILDLRSNGGGLLDQAVAISDMFLDSGEIVSQRGRRASETERYNARPGQEAQGLPVIVLIDAGTASASEIVAGALQDHHRALIMGETSFGKGSVQTVLSLTDNTALKLTTARYYTPSGHSVQEGGIVPDLPVPQISDPDYRNRPVFRESSLRRHLAGDARISERGLEDDGTADPRFSQTAEQLRQRGIDDFQMYYALQTMARLAANSRLITQMQQQHPAQPAARQPAARANR